MTQEPTHLTRTYHHPARDPAPKPNEFMGRQKSFLFGSSTFDPSSPPRQKPFQIFFHFCLGSLLLFLMMPEWQSLSPKPVAPGRGPETPRWLRTTPQPSLCEAMSSPNTFPKKSFMTCCLNGKHFFLRDPVKQLTGIFK